MVWFSFYYSERPVKLFSEYGPDHLVRESHPRQGDLSVASVIDRVREAVGAADHKYNIFATAERHLPYFFREFDGTVLFPMLVQQYDPCRMVLCS